MARSRPAIPSQALVDPVDIEIGGRVRARREALRITQAQLANGVGVTFQQVQKYERGNNRISSARLLRIAAVLKTTGSDLLGELEHANGPSAMIAQPGAARLLAGYSILSRDKQAALLTLVEGMAA
ncbi:helix-turn-helix domain-containing protein [Brevundimonas nasdae]|uniref:Helix-turn-helix domain-containing protein n=1 Tax=Brevundimonas nasdae TaxID=172043 RepID=A0ABX8TMF2_9CAUL|nr:helix-turn-helix transcriptional regulator [Brevundimonas nasdae]QYC12398.1 helix-turn-helix domain-containing protein [Brevundimonas nasdae]